MSEISLRPDSYAAIRDHEQAAAPVAPAALPDYDSWTLVVGEVSQLASMIANTEFVPEAMRGKPAAVAAAMLTGREMGLSPMTSLRHIHLVKGKPGQSAELMRALVQRAGHELRYVDTTDTRCVVEGKRRGEHEWTRVTFTADQAKRARIDLGGYPEDKLVARATSRLCRRKFADVIAGMPYTVDELEDVADERPVSDSLAEPAPARRTARRAPRQEAAPTVPAPPPAEPDLEADAGPEQPLITSAQLRKLHVVLGERGLSDRDAGLRAISDVVGRQVVTSRELTRDEASRAIDTLENGVTEPPLDDDPTGGADPDDADRPATAPTGGAA